jgi:anti-anti-sigma factor
MDIEVLEQAEALTRLALAGRLDVVGADSSGKKLDELLGGRGVNAVVDIAGVDFIASMGIGVLLRNANALGRKGRRLVLLSPQPLVEEVLRMAGLDQVTPLAHSSEEALRLLEG